MDISLNIRRARVAAGLSQRGLARRLGISSVAVAKWEKGQSYPSADRIPALADALGVPIYHLYGRDSPPAAHVPAIMCQGILASRVVCPDHSTE